MPGVSTSSGPTEDLDVNVYVTASGAIQVQGRQVPLDGLEDAFIEAVRVGGKKSMVLAAAGPVRHETIVAVMDRARSAGIHEVVFARAGE